MFNKKTIIIIISVVIIFILLIATFFLLKIENKDLDNKKVLDSTNSISANNSEKNKVIANNLNELKNLHPEYSPAQLKFFSDTADEENILLCEHESNAKECVSAVAYLLGHRTVCNNLIMLGENNALFNECNNTITKKIAKTEISRCDTLSGDDYYNCLIVLFNIANQELDCSIFSEVEVREFCQNFLNFNKAFFSYDRELCKTVKTEKLNQYCLAVIKDKNQDTDSDGLTDLDEINKYKTNYLVADTDGDGHSDGEEVKNGFNPSGPGKLIMNYK